MNGSRFTIAESPTREDIHFLEDRIYEFNVAATNIKDGRLLSIFVRDADQQIAAGLYGWTWGGCLEIEYLWVRADLRRQGYGKNLLRTAEQEAIARGCQQSLLNTHSFQAPEFYQKFGYERVGVYENYPMGHQQFFLRKSLSATSA